MTTDRIAHAKAVLERLEDAAKAATAGEWLAASSNKRRDGIALVGVMALRGQGERGCIAVLAGSGGGTIKDRHANAAHIASWSPSLALPVIAMMRWLLLAGDEQGFVVHALTKAGLLS